MTVLNRPICFFRIFSASDLKSNRLAGLKAFIWSNLCTRHLPNTLTPRGHEDWPDKRATRRKIRVGGHADAGLGRSPMKRRSNSLSWRYVPKSETGRLGADPRKRSLLSVHSALLGRAPPCYPEKHTRASSTCAAGWSSALVLWRFR